MRLGWLFALGVVALTGCGSGDKSRTSSLEFEQLADTAGLTRGEPLLTAFEPYRMSNGAMRVRGTVGFPDGTRLQVAIYRKPSRQMVQSVQVTIVKGAFDSPPVIGEQGPLPPGDYHFELRTFFDSSWQPAAVLHSTADGRTLHGPGITRDRLGRAAFLLERDVRL
jgi:hypothetical protein